LPGFLRKLGKLNWSMFEHPTDVVSDLIGARVVCWFIDDYYGILDYIQATKQFLVRPLSLEDYIKDPKSSGYRAIHILADVSYDRVKTFMKRRTVVADRMICEIQIRTKFQDAWGEFTHDLHTKIPAVFQEEFKTAISDIANRLATEDRSTLVVRNLLQMQEWKDDPEDSRND
jgi:putative GTP pyrophosphokinase